MGVRARRGEQRRLVLNVEGSRAVGVLMRRLKERLRFGLRRVDRRARRRFDDDLTELSPLSDDQILCSRQREDDDVVLILKAVRALWREQAFDRVLRAVEL